MVRKSAVAKTANNQQCLQANNALHIEMDALGIDICAIGSAKPIRRVNTIHHFGTATNSAQTDPRSFIRGGQLSKADIKASGYWKRGVTSSMFDEKRMAD